MRRDILFALAAIWTGCATAPAPHVMRSERMPPVDAETPCGPIVRAACSDGSTESLSPVGDGRLCTAGAEGYRFTWMRTFHHPVSVRATRTDTRATLVAAEFSGMGGYEIGTRVASRDVRLDADQWSRIERLADSTGIGFRGEQPERLSGYDGASWRLEAVRDGEYSAMTCWNPSTGTRGQTSPMARWGLYMLRLADLMPEDASTIY